MRNSLVRTFIVVGSTLFLSLFLARFSHGQQKEEPDSIAYRMELGKRLKRFEQTWQEADAEERKASTESMQRAVQAFFSLQLAEAGEQLDLAWKETTNPPQWQSSAARFSVSVAPKVLTADVAKFQINIQTLYGESKLISDFAKENDLKTLKVSLADSAQNELRTTTIKTFEIESNFITIDEKVFPEVNVECDYFITVSAERDNESFEWPVTVISRVDDYQSQVQELSDQTVAARKVIDDTVYASLKEIVAVLELADRPSAYEVEYPLHELLELGQSLIEEPNDALKKLNESARKKAIWMAAGQNRKRVALRVQCPVSTDDSSKSSEPLPVLFLFHGAGGSENMFYETYGAGCYFEMGLERGYLVVAPRLGFSGMSLGLPQLLDELEKVFEIDRSRVAVVGHSMGAAQVVQQASQHPSHLTAAVALGGGRGMRDVSSVKDLPWLVAAGELDFGRRGAKALHQSLDRGGANSTYLEYEDVEHMVIVQAAAADVFDFLDSHIPPKKTDGQR